MKATAVILMSALATALAGNVRSNQGWAVSERQGHQAGPSEVRQRVYVVRKPLPSNQVPAATQQLSGSAASGWPSSFPASTRPLNGHSQFYESGSSSSGTNEPLKSSKPQWKNPGTSSDWPSNFPAEQTSPAREAAQAIRGNNGNGYRKQSYLAPSSTADGEWKLQVNKQPKQAYSSDTGSSAPSRQDYSNNKGGWQVQNSESGQAMSAGGHEHVFTIKTVNLDSHSSPHGDHAFFSGAGPMHSSFGAPMTEKQIYIIKTLGPDHFMGVQMNQAWPSDWDMNYAAQFEAQMGGGWVPPSTSSKKQVYFIRSLPSTMMQQLPFGWPAGVRRPSNKHSWH
ncbi:unnamed protein product [Ixodes persulcatus]